MAPHRAGVAGHRACDRLTAIRPISILIATISVSRTVCWMFLWPGSGIVPSIGEGKPAGQEQGGLRRARLQRRR
jgi:hypothetical protein